MFNQIKQPAPESPRASQLILTPPQYHKPISAPNSIREAENNGYDCVEKAMGKVCLRWRVCHFKNRAECKTWLHYAQQAQKYEQERGK
jgi:hypothetical protein